MWNFLDGSDRFGPPLIFKMIVAANGEDEDPTSTEMKDYNKGVEMKSIGISAAAQEMVEISKKETSEESEDEDKEEEAKDEDEAEEGFDLLANEVDFLSLESQQSSKETDEFEVIPIPACFDLEVPFEIVDNKDGGQELQNMKRRENVEVETPLKKADLQKASVENEPIEKLVKLGFADRAKNLRLLELHQHDLETVVKKLYEENNLDWAAIRH